MTQLFRHQRRSLAFMLRREGPSERRNRTGFLGGGVVQVSAHDEDGEGGGMGGLDGMGGVDGMAREWSVGRMGGEGGQAAVTESSNVRWLMLRAAPSSTSSSSPSSSSSSYSSSSSSSSTPSPDTIDDRTVHVDLLTGMVAGATVPTNEGQVRRMPRTSIREVCCSIVYDKIHFDHYNLN